MTAVAADEDDDDIGTQMILYTQTLDNDERKNQMFALIEHDQIIQICTELLKSS